MVSPYREPPQRTARADVWRARWALLRHQWLTPVPADVMVSPFNHPYARRARELEAALRRAKERRR